MFVARVELLGIHDEHLVHDRLLGLADDPGSEPEVSARMTAAEAGDRTFDHSVRSLRDRYGIRSGQPRGLEPAMCATIWLSTAPLASNELVNRSSGSGGGVSTAISVMCV